MFIDPLLLFLQFFSPLSKVKDEQQNGMLELVDLDDEWRYVLLISPDRLAHLNLKITFKEISNMPLL